MAEKLGPLLAGRSDEDPASRRDDSGDG